MNLILSKLKKISFVLLMFFRFSLIAQDLDHAFGNDGIVITDVDSTEDCFYVVDVAVQADGKIVVGGYTPRNGTPYDCALVRYNQDGTLDSTFNGSGIVLYSIGISGIQPVDALAIEPNGKILMFGNRANPYKLARFNNNGSLDTIIYIYDSYSISSGEDILVQPDGKILALGYDELDEKRIHLFRFNSDLTFDATFSYDGKATFQIGALPQAHGFALQTDGKIVIAGSKNSGEYSVLLRCKPDGSLDTTFNHNGIVAIDHGGGYNTLNAVAIQPDGKIVATGKSGNNLVVARFNSNGTPDSSFNSIGFDLQSYAVGYDILARSDGKVFVSGNNGGATLWEFHSGGSSLNSAFFSMIDNAIAIQEPGGYIIQAVSTDCGFSIARFKSDFISGTKSIASSLFSIQATPNPADKYLNLKINSIEKAVIKLALYNYTGMKFHDFPEYTIENGYNELPLHLPEILPPGYYYLAVIGEKNRAIIQLTILKN